MTSIRTIIVLIVLIVVSALAGCAAPRSNAMPVIDVRPGFVERIAIMDRYRLHDEERKLMMARPHVWVEELSDADDADSSADEAPEALKTAE